MVGSPVVYQQLPDDPDSFGVAETVVIVRGRDLDGDTHFDFDLVGLRPTTDFIYDTPTGRAFSYPSLIEGPQLVHGDGTVAVAVPLHPEGLVDVAGISEIYGPNLTSRVNLRGLHVDEQVQSLSPADRFERTDPVWASDGDLQVTGTIIDPLKAADSQSDQFRAGVVVGISGGLLVLALEFAVEAAREARAGRREERAALLAERHEAVEAARADRRFTATLRHRRRQHRLRQRP